MYDLLFKLELLYIRDSVGVFVVNRTEVVMRAACVIILASLAVFLSPGLQCQALPGESDPSLDELFQRAETLLIRSILTQMEDENNDNGVCLHSLSVSTNTRYSFRNSKSDIVALMTRHRDRTKIIFITFVCLNVGLF